MAVKAKESPQILRARKKIKANLEEAEKRTSKEALKEMSRLIQRHLARHKDERVSLKTKQITLFDENKHPARTESKFVNHLLNELQHPKKSKQKNQLEGRIKSTSH